MPCSMAPISFNSTGTNDGLKSLGDELTHELDMIREAVLNDQQPDFSAFDVEWSELLDYAENEYEQQRSGPSTGVLVNEKLLSTVANLYKQYEQYRKGWRKDRCASMTKEIVAHQIAHRQEDLDRLAHHFVNTREYDLLRKVIEADPFLPLAPQLGFDPDDY